MAQFGRPPGCVESWCIPGKTHKMPLADAHARVQQAHPAALWNATLASGFWYVSRDDRRVVGEAIAAPCRLGEPDLWFCRFLPTPAWLDTL